MGADDMGGGMQQRDRDLVLPPSTYAYVLDSTKGKVSAYVGPYKASLSNTDQLVVWEPSTSRFRTVNDLEQAIRTFQTAGEGEYIVLTNPAQGSVFSPPHGNIADAVDLQVGKKVNVPGPVTFPLWPGQAAESIDGHHLRHNQYLVVRVYDPIAAEENAAAAVVAPQTGTTDTTVVTATSYAIGQLIIVKGTEVSFYIPPTGIEVVRDGDGSYVREAVTLERLEYCVLLDESGAKRYEQGPQVVFPEPTERFMVSGSNKRAFQAIELNPHSGVYVKVVAEYEDDDGVHPVGEELFITGATNPIYFPRAEHSLVEYAGRVKHFAVAIPEGEGRYVLDRDEGNVNLVKGPEMFLPDPRKEVVVLRVLDPHTVELLYPGNVEAQRINLERASESGRLPEGQHLVSNVAVAAATDMDTTRNIEASAVAATTKSGLDIPTRQRAYAGGSTLARSTTYSEPRTIVLDTKYEGAVAVNVWPGYAVLVVDRSDNRRVVVGPKNVLLTYDESLMPLELSTGRPKDDKELMRTAYLRVTNNQVGDLVTVETADLVEAQVHVSYRVNFEGEDHERWFAVENYVKVLTDHCRSRLRNAVKRLGVAEFYANSIDVIRDTLLGENVAGERTGLPFPENGMRLYDVEVLDVRITDPTVASMFTTSTKQAIAGAIELATATQASSRLGDLEELRRSDAMEREATEQTLASIERESIQRRRDLDLGRASAALAVLEADQERHDRERREMVAEAEADASVVRSKDEPELDRLRVETELYERRLAAASEELVQALSRFGDDVFITELTKAIGPAALAAGVRPVDMFKQVFAGTPFEGAFDTLAERVPTNGALTPTV